MDLDKNELDTLISILKKKQQEEHNPRKLPKFPIRDEIKVSEGKYTGKDKLVLEGKEMRFKPSGLLGFGSKKPKTLIIYLGQNDLRFFKTSVNYDTIIKNIKNELHYTNPNIKTPNKFFHNGMRILWLSNQVPIELELDIDKKKFLADPVVSNAIYDQVVEHRLTNARMNLDLMGFIKKYWIVIALIIVVMLLSQQEGGISGMLGGG